MTPAPPVIVSNYPRGEGSSDMTPALAKSILELSSVMAIWIVAPNAFWALMCIPAIQEILFGPSAGVLRPVVVAVTLLLFFVTLLALWAIRRYLHQSSQAVLPRLALWALSFVPLLGFIGPVLIGRDLMRTIRRYGVTGPNGRFPRAQLQAIADGDMGQGDSP